MDIAKLCNMLSCCSLTQNSLLYKTRFTVLLECYIASLCHHFCENTRKWKQTAVEIDFARCMNKEIHLILYHLVF